MHLYWSLKDRPTLTYVIPTKNNGELLFKPKPVIIFMIFLVCLVIALLTLGFHNVNISSIFLFIKYFIIGVGLVFLARAIGDFKWVGFFKKNKNSEFAKLDQALYSPLCLYLGLSYIYIAVS